MEGEQWRHHRSRHQPGGELTPPPAAVRAVPVRHPGRWLAAAAVLVLVADIVYSLATARTLHWDVVRYWLFDGRILNGIVVTLKLTILAMLLGVVLGVALAVMRLSANPVMSVVSGFYIWLFRGTPVYVQILFWGNVSLLFPRLSIGIPFGGPTWLSADTNQVVTLFVAAVLGLGLNEAAYMAEIVRAGIISVDPGQTEAAQALGMSRGQIMRRVVLPQAMRVIVPPTGNETISMLKTTSLVSVISVSELLDSAIQIYAVNYRTLELLIVASIWYVVVTSILSVGQYFVERRFARGSSRGLPPTPLQRLRSMLIWRRATVGEQPR
jgi:polar amino acid transport system permease protein